MSQSTKNTLRVVGTIMWIVGAVAFVAGLFTGGTGTPLGSALVIGGAVLFGLGLLVDSMADGGIFIIVRLFSSQP